MLYCFWLHLKAADKLKYFDKCFSLALLPDLRCSICWTFMKFSDCEFLECFLFLSLHADPDLWFGCSRQEFRTELFWYGVIWLYLIDSFLFGSYWSGTERFYASYRMYYFWFVSTCKSLVYLITIDPCLMVCRAFFLRSKLLLIRSLLSWLPGYPEFIIIYYILAKL